MTLPAIIPRSVLFGIPEKHEPILSPDGHRIAYVAPVDGIRTIWVGPAEPTGHHPLPATTHHGITTVRWAHDGRHLVYQRDSDGDENPHLHAVDIVTGRVRDLTPFPGVQTRLLGLSALVPGQVLVGMNRRDRSLHDVYAVHLRTGEIGLVVENPGFAGWMVDRQLRPRAAFEWASDGGLSIMVDDGDRWRAVHTVDSEDSTATRPISFNTAGDALTVLSSGDANTSRVVRIDVASGVGKVLYEDPSHDVMSVDVDPRSGEADMVVVDRERPWLEALNPQVADNVTDLYQRFAGNVVLIGRDNPDRNWLVLDYSPDRAATYHHYNRATTQLRPLFMHRSELTRYTMAPVEPFSFPARDGLTIHGYLTFPPGLGRGHLATVLVVHGGPWARDRWGAGECQWLANRGYLCVQVNFRGSTGYGKDFVNAGDREWGGRMQDDLTDAVRWLIARGHADPRRVAIYGGSYGGYAALVGVAFTPELYRCAVAVCAPSDLRSFVRSTTEATPLLGPRIRRRIGDHDLDGDFLWSRSPLSRVDAIRAPVLVAHGANDPRVPRAEADQVVAALARNGVPHRYVLFEDEGHTFTKVPNRLAFYHEAERFLAEYLGGRCEPASDPPRG